MTAESPHEVLVESMTPPEVQTGPASAAEVRPPKASKRRARPQSWIQVAERFALPALLAATVVFFASWQPAFKTSANINSLLTSQSVILVLAVGLIVPLLAGNFDLSIGAIASFSSIASALLMADKGFSAIPAVLAGVVIACGIGLFNGILVAYAHLNALIATLGTSIVLSGAISWITDDLSVTGISFDITDLAIQTFLGVPMLAVLALGAAALVGYLATQTPFGRRLTSIGSNRDAATLVGIHVQRLELVSFVCSGGLGGVAGILLLSQQGSGNPGVNSIALILPALAAVYLGASAIKPGEFNVTGTIIGLLLVSSIVSGLTLAGVDAWVQNVVTGGALIVAIGTSTALRRHRLGTQ